MAEEATNGVVLSEHEESDKRLHRALTFWDLFALSMGGIIGSGWLLASLGAQGVAGPAVLFSWLIGGILVLFIALNYAEVAGMLPRSGAIVRYPHLTHGSYAGYILGWAYFLTGVTVPTIEAEAVVTYASSYIPGLTTKAAGVTVLTGPGILFGIVLLIIFALLNYFGVKLMGRLNTWITVWKFVIPALTFILLFTLFKASNFTAYGGLTPLGISPLFLAIPNAGIVFAYLGFRQALDYGGEARNPQRDVPLATITCVLVAAVLYTVLQIAFTGAFSWSVAGIHAGNWAGLASSSLAKAPIASTMQASGVALLGAFSVLLYIDAFVSPAGTGLVYLGTSMRTIYGMSMDGYFPGIFNRIHERWGIPVASLVASVVVGCIVLAPLPSWYELVGLISSGTVLTYIMGGVGLRVLRRTAPQLHRPFRLGGSAVLAPIAFIAATLIVFWSGTATLNYIITAVFIGLPIYAWLFAPQKLGANPVGSSIAGIVMLIVVLVTAIFGPLGQKALSFYPYFVLLLVEVALFTLYMWLASSPEKRRDILAGVWFIVLAFGLYLLSYLSKAFGSSPKTAPLPFPWDNLIVIVFSLVVFYWAVASGFETPEIDALTSAAAAQGQVASPPSTPDAGIGEAPAD
jgi:amino acid transporter